MQVWSLNGARFAGRTPDDPCAPLEWLQSLDLPGADVPDVLCLQDFRVSLLRHLRPLPYFHFTPMTNHRIWGGRELLGVCIASRWPLEEIVTHPTWGAPGVRDLQGVDENNERLEPLDLSESLVLQTQNRVVLACSVCAPGYTKPLRIATHHGFWTRAGEPTPEQMTSTQAAVDFLAQQARSYGGLVYMADYNPDKLGRVHGMYLASGARDCLPVSIATTLAPAHPASSLGIKSDCVMLWPDAAGAFYCSVRNARLDPAPGSDHLMIRCDVEPT